MNEGLLTTLFVVGGFSKEQELKIPGQIVDLLFSER